MLRYGPVSTDLWAPGAIGNAEWTGVSLAEVLHTAGTSAGADFKIAFSAPDDCQADGERFRYGV